MLFGLLFNGLAYPKLSAAFGASWVVGRFLYTYGYVTGRPEARYSYGGSASFPYLSSIAHLILTRTLCTRSSAPPHRLGRNLVPLILRRRPRSLRPPDLVFLSRTLSTLPDLQSPSPKEGTRTMDVAFDFLLDKRTDGRGEGGREKDVMQVVKVDSKRKNEENRGSFLRVPPAGLNP